MRNHRKSERGNHTLEFTLIGLPLTFLLFSIANMCFSMLTLHTLQQAVEQGGRYAVTRGSTCSSGTNTCSAKVQDIAAVVAKTAAGISPSKLNLTLIPASGTGNQISCAPVKSCLSTCSDGCNGSRATVWPPSTNNDNSPGTDIVLTANCSLSAPMFMFWNGSPSATHISSTAFGAYTRQRLMF
jgi:Flp pilus assembly protein TadG